MPERPLEDPRSLVGRLYDCYGASLYRYAVMLLADRVAAEDAVHQVFAALLGLRGRMDNEGHYLRRAVRNECYSMLRRRRRDVADRAPLLEVGPMAVDAPEERMMVERAIRELPPDQREVVHLHVFEGLTFREIADLSELSINTVAARYRYALARMKQTLAPL